MIVVFAKKGDGTSFKGVVRYLMHDVGHAPTSQRVGWSHTLNLAHDDSLSAVHEMFTTHQNAELLKAEAGIRLGGSRTHKAVKHVSLNWHPSEEPGREDMIAAAQSLLKHMGWSDHQALLIAHTDKPHRHVHLVVNTVHPETGLKLDDGFERRRAQQWAKAYELEHGKVFCEQRLKKAAEREAAPPRPAWMAMKDHVLREIDVEHARFPFDASYTAREENRRIIEGREWELLREIQKEERLAFFAEGKQIYRNLNRAAYQEVRAEFRPQWSSYFAAKRDGLDFGVLNEIRADLIARQKEVLNQRQKEATTPVRKARDAEYQAFLRSQKESRAELADRQERGLPSPHLLDRRFGSEAEAWAKTSKRGRDGGAAIDGLDRFGIRRGRTDGAVGMEAAGFGRPVPSRERTPSVEEAAFSRSPASVELRPKNDLASGLAGGLLSIIGGIGESFTGASGKPRRPPPTIDPLERFGIRRGVPPPDHDEKRRAANDKETRDADWKAWKDRLLDR